MERWALIHNAVPCSLFQCNGLSPHEITFGSQGDISNLCVFGWYEWAYNRDHGSFPVNKERFGRVLGPLQNEGNEMAQAVLTSTGTVIPRHTLGKLTHAEIHGIITCKLGTSITFPTKPLPKDHVPYSDYCEPDLVNLSDDNGPVGSNGNDLFEQHIADRWIHTELHLPQGEEFKSVKVVGRSIDDNGNVVEKYDDNPMLNTLTYDVEFSDGEVQEYSANVIAENMYTQVDTEGFHHNLLEVILDYKKESNAVEKDDMYITTKKGTKCMRKTTAGWKLLVQWKMGEQE